MLESNQPVETPEKAFEMLVINLVADQAKILPIAFAEKHFLNAITKYTNNKKLRELFAYRFVKYAETLLKRALICWTKHAKWMNLPYINP